MHWLAAVAWLGLAAALATLVAWLCAGRPAAAPSAVRRVSFGKRKRAQQTKAADNKARHAATAAAKPNVVVAASAGLRYGLVPDERTEVAVVRRASLAPREEGEVPFRPRTSGWRAALRQEDGAIQVVRPDGGSAGTYTFGRRWRHADVSSDSRLLAAVAEDEPARVHLFRRDVFNDDAFESWTTLASDLPVQRVRFAVESFVLLTAHAGGAVRAYRLPERTKGASPKLAYADEAGAPEVRGLVREPGRLVLLS